MPGLNVRPDGVDERKWRQIGAFLEVAIPRLPPDLRELVDWCAGKGHLGRTASLLTGLPVLSVELNSSLVTAGRDLARRASASVSFVVADVNCWPIARFAPSSSSPGVLALHACGDLNVRLLKEAVAAAVPFLVLAPCCYERIGGTHYQPLSLAARSAVVPLTRHQLRVSSTNEATTTTACRALRRREDVFRLAADVLLRQWTRQDAYRPLGSFPSVMFRGSLRDFVKQAFARIDVPLPDSVDWCELEQRGIERYWLVSALSVPRRVFRRLLESWLFLDRICFLEEAGYTVEAGTFCPSIASPRNLMLIAHRIKGTNIQSFQFAGVRNPQNRGQVAR